MVIDFQEAKANQVRKRVLKARTARALVKAYEVLRPHQTIPEVEAACEKLHAAARRLEPF